MTIETPSRLTKSAKEHIEQGGCGGDLCSNCGGEGDERYPDPSGRAGYVVDNCHVCNGRGMR